MASREILQEAKDKLRITWPEEDARVLKLIESAQTDLNKLCSMKLCYDVEGPAKTLMLEHVFFNWNNALYEFRKNYIDEIMELTILAAIGGVTCVQDE